MTRISHIVIGPFHLNDVVLNYYGGAALLEREEATTTRGGQCTNDQIPAYSTEQETAQGSS